MRNSIGSRLRLERKRLGLTQGKFAELANVQGNTQSNYESDARRPDADYLATAIAIGVDVNFVLTGQASKATLQGEEAQLVECYRQAIPVLRAAALATLRLQPTEPEVTQSFHGDVGQAVSGDLTVAAPQTFAFKQKSTPSKKPKPSPV